MSKDTFYINLDNEGIKPASPPQAASAFQQLDAFGNQPSYFRYLTDELSFDYFLYNPINSGKVIKIKSLNLNEIPATRAGITAGNIVIQKSTAVVSGSDYVSYTKMDTNAADLPSTIGFVDNIATYTSTGTFRQKPGLITGTSQTSNIALRANYPSARHLNSPSIYNNENSTNIQSITLQAGESLTIGFSSTTTRTPVNYVFSATLVSGSNTYYYNKTLINSLTNPHIGSFVNNSSTNVKITDITLASPPAFAFSYNYNAISSVNLPTSERIYHTTKLTKEQIGHYPFSGLDNMPDTLQIQAMDTNVPIPGNIACYKTYTPPTGILGLRNRYPDSVNANAQTIGLNHLRIRYQFGHVVATRVGNIEVNFMQNDQKESKYDFRNSEIVLNPGEGYGILLYGSELGIGDGGNDSIGTGHLLFTVEDVIATTTETGFGY